MNLSFEDFFVITQSVFRFEDFLFFLISYTKIFWIKDLLFLKICFISCLHFHFLLKVVFAIFIEIKYENSRNKAKS